MFPHDGRNPPCMRFLPRGVREAAVGRRKTFQFLGSRNFETSEPSSAAPPAIPCDSRASRAVRPRHRETPNPIWASLSFRAAGRPRLSRRRAGRLLSAAGDGGGNRRDTMNFMNFTSDAGLIFHTVSAMCPPVRGEGHALSPRSAF